MSEKKFSFVYITDMQPGSPKSYRFNPAWMENWKTAKQQIIDLQPDFLLIGGDVTRDGSFHKWELQDMKKDFDSMSIPYYVIPGNMDTGNKHTEKQGFFDHRDDIALNITSEHLKNWKDVFGDWKWTFTYNNVRVSGICDMIINSGLPEEQELWQWLEEQKKLPKMEHHVWLMHSALFIERPDEPNWDLTKADEYGKWYFSIDLPGRAKLFDIFKATGATRVITGHIHCMHDSEFDGINFDYAPATCGTQFTEFWPEGTDKLGFYQYLVNGKDIERNYIPLDNISKRKDGYGPGGHPKPEDRDYSLAWEKS